MGGIRRARGRNTTRAWELDNDAHLLHDRILPHVVAAFDELRVHLRVWRGSKRRHLRQQLSSPSSRAPGFGCPLHGRYKSLQVVTGRYWSLLIVTGRYWSLLVVTGRYRVPGLQGSVAP